MTIDPRTATRATLLALAAFVAAGPSSAAPEAPARRKAADLVLDYGFPPIPPEHAKLESVPFAPGAPAVILLEAEMHEQQLGSGNVMQRVHYWRRVKILTTAGGARWGDWARTFYGFRRVQTVEARTVLPGGEIVDAKDSVFREMAVGDTAERDVRMIRVAWPRVQVGAILDLYMSWLDEGIPVLRWSVQHDVPVLDSRVILQVPKEFQFNRVGVLMRPEEAVPLDARHPRGMLHVWAWENVPPSESESFAPPPDDAVRSIVIYPAALEFRGRYAEYAPDWTQWGKAERDRWDAWWSKRSAAARQLAAAATEGVDGPLAKAEAIRRALLEKVRIGSYEIDRRRASPDDVLTAGEGASGEVAAIAQHMMKSVGLEADLVAFRRRSTGRLVKVAPIPTMLDDALVRLGGSVSPLYVGFDGVSPAGILPPEAAGVTAIPLDASRTGPIDLPEPKAPDSGVRRVTRGAIDRDGVVSATTVATFRGASASAWRATLRPLDERRRVELFENELRQFVPGATVSGLTLRGLDDLGRDLEAELTWRADGYATRAGGRMLFRMALFGRARAEDWAAEGRTADIDFGYVGVVSDETTLTLPDGVAAVNVPPPVEADGAPVGRFVSSHLRDGANVTFTRELRIDVARLSPSAWAFVRPWFQGIAEADDAAVVVELP